MESMVKSLHIYQAHRGEENMGALLLGVVTCLLVGASMTVVLLPGCGGKKPDLAIYDVKFSLIKSTDPLSDIMHDEWRRSTKPSDPKLKQFLDEITKNTQRSHEADPHKWGYWFTCYIKNRGDKDTFQISIKPIPLPTPRNMIPRRFYRSLSTGMNSTSWATPSSCWTI